MVKKIALLFSVLFVIALQSGTCSSKPKVDEIPDWLILVNDRGSYDRVKTFIRFRNEWQTSNPMLGEYDPEKQDAKRRAYLLKLQLTLARGFKYDRQKKF